MLSGFFTSLTPVLPFVDCSGAYGAGCIAPALSGIVAVALHRIYPFLCSIIDLEHAVMTIGGALYSGATGVVSMIECMHGQMDEWMGAHGDDIFRPACRRGSYMQS